MNFNDQKSRKRTAFINFYLADKEFFLSDELRGALDFIYMLTHKKKMDKALAIHKVNEWYQKKYKIEYGKDFLWSKYNSRMALIKNASEKYYEWCIEKRKQATGVSKLCACGCGQEVKKGNKFIHGHHRRILSQEEKELNAERMRKARELKKKNNIIEFKSYKNL